MRSQMVASGSGATRLPVFGEEMSMYLEMQIVDDRDADSKSCRPVGSVPSLSDAEDRRERLVALLQCAYSWSRAQALQQVVKWLALESDEFPDPEGASHVSDTAKRWQRPGSVVAFLERWPGWTSLRWRVF
jgi:hypothetical protein